MTRLEFAAWAEQYGLRDNPNGMSGPALGDTVQLYEPYGEDWRVIEAAEIHHVWTLLDCDGHMIVACGCCVVNRVGYYLTEKPWTEADEGELEIYDADEVECPTCHDVCFYDLTNHECDPDCIDTETP